MSAADSSTNLATYRTPEVVAHYAALGYLTPCEQLLFDTWVRPGAAVLDLGVGGGRTTPHLSATASRYVGIDYSEEMIHACRTKYPGVQFEVADASDLSRFGNGAFDVIVFSFNGIDYLFPDHKREQCLRECHRLLKPEGRLVFSSHNPRSLVVGWDWDWDRLRSKARGIAAGRLSSGVVLAGLASAKLGLTLWRATAQSTPRALRRLSTSTFWLGGG